MELRTRDYTEAQRQRLGDALTMRRVRLNPSWSNRAEFIRATGIDKKLSERLETGEPGNYRASTVALAARAYAVTPESMAAVLRGGTLVPVAGTAGAPEADDLTPQCTVEKVVIETEGLPEAMKRDFVRVHRLRGHSADCNPFAPGESQPQSALASLSAAAL